MYLYYIKLTDRTLITSQPCREDAITMFQDYDPTWVSNNTFKPIPNIFGVC